MTSTTPSSRPGQWPRWMERLIVLVALINFCLVIFDSSYVYWRDVYLKEAPQLVELYDPIKGIEPHRETQLYLSKVDQLKAQIRQGEWNFTTGTQEAAPPEVEALLQELRQLSDEMIEDNPFAIAQKSGTLEKIKNQIRDYVGVPSSHRAFDTFWSSAYLAQVDWLPDIEFFETEVRPLIETNYYRGISFNGKFIDNFWQIDAPFVAFFGLEFLVRTFLLSWRQSGLSWLGAMLRRWYDLFLLFPAWRWLRAIPITIRLQQAQLINLEPIRKQINYDFAINFAEELTELVGVRIIDQAQDAIQRGEPTRWLFDAKNRPYVDVNNTNEVQAIATRLLYLSVYEVLPKIQPDLEALLHYSIESTLNKSPIYRQLQNVPGLNRVPDRFAERLAKELTQAAYSTLADFLADPTAAELSDRLVTNFGKTLEVEVKKQPNWQEIQLLLTDLLEEIKINYVKGIAEGGVEKFVEEANQLHRMAYRER